VCSGDVLGDTHEPGAEPASAGVGQRRHDVDIEGIGRERAQRDHGLEDRAQGVRRSPAAGRPDLQAGDDARALVDHGPEPVPRAFGLERGSDRPRVAAGLCHPRPGMEREPVRSLVHQDRQRRPVRLDRRPEGRIEAGHAVRQISLPKATAVSAMRLEKPHSLSYQDITRQKVPSITLVWSMWKIEERLS
jgi:hypothetical protein